MGKQRICSYCKKPISWLTSVLFNNCCSYKCDISFEKERIYGKPQSAPNNQNHKKYNNVALDPNFINNEDEDDDYDYGFNDDIENKIIQNDIFYPQIEKPVDTFGFLQKKAEPVPVEIKTTDPYKRGEHYENKRSGYYDEINGQPNYYDNGEIGFYSNRNPGYYDDMPKNNDEDDDNIVNQYDDDNNKIEDEVIEENEINNSNDDDDNYYNEDEDYQITHNDEDE